MKNNRYDFMLAIFFTLIFMFSFFGVYVLPTFQTDTYAKWFYSLEAYLNQCFSTTRYAEALYVWLSFHILGNPVQHRLTHVTIACIINCIIALYIWRVLYRRMRLWEKSDGLNVLLILGVICLRANVFYSDIFQYGYDAAVTFLGDGCAIIAAVITSEKKTAKAFIGACLIGIVAMMFRQTSLVWFVIISMLLYFLDYLENKKYPYVIELIKRIGVYVIIGFSIILSVKVFVPDPARGSLEQVNLQLVWESLSITIKRLFKDCLGVLPQYYYSILIIIAGGVLLVLIFSVKLPNRRWKSVLVSGISVAGIFGATFATAIFDTWLPHRVLIGFTSLLPILVILCIGILSNENELKYERKLILVMFMVIVPYILISWYFTINIFRGQVITNAVDQRNAVFYYNQMIKYEKATGNEIKNVAFKNDEKYTAVFPGVIATKSINERAFSAPWSQREIIRLLRNKILIVVPFDEDVYSTYFLGKNWDELSEEQIKCIDDTAYIMLY